ncbi:MAG: hypothetical protein WC796_04410 [Candidatus Pacearchaeota archaeon]|jgi:hypothetical protein
MEEVAKSSVSIKPLSKRDRRKFYIIGIIAIVVLILAVYFTFFFSVKCKDISCWEYKLQRCAKAHYLSDSKDVTWLYNIEGKKDKLCNVEVTAKEIKSGLTSALVLEGKSMDCVLPLGVITSPESDPNLCSGPLKEEMQGLIIKKLHEYIVSNIGQINEDLNKVDGVSS